MLPRMPQTNAPTSRSKRRRPGGPRRWTAADRTRYLAAFARSGQAIKAFCAEVGVPRATFTYWQREARARRTPDKHRGERKAPVFAQVELVAPAPEPGLSMVVRSPSGIATELSGLDKTTAESIMRLILTTRAR